MAGKNISVPWSVTYCFCMCDVHVSWCILMNHGVFRVYHLLQVLSGIQYCEAVFWTRVSFFPFTNAGDLPEEGSSFLPPFANEENKELDRYIQVQHPIRLYLKAYKFCTYEYNTFAFHLKERDLRNKVAVTYALCQTNYCFYVGSSAARVWDGMITCKQCRWSLDDSNNLFFHLLQPLSHWFNCGRIRFSTVSWFLSIPALPLEYCLTKPGFILSLVIP